MKVIRFYRKLLFPIVFVSVLFFPVISCGGPELLGGDEIETKIRDILSLPTYEYVYRDVVYVGEKASFLGIPTKDKEALFSIDVVVQGGIDLTEGFRIEINEDRKVTVSMTPAKVLSIDADESSIAQYFVKEWGGKLSTLQYYDEINRKKVFLEEDAVSRGILLKAEENARQLVRNFLTLSGFTEIEFKKIRPGRVETSAETSSDSSSKTDLGGADGKE